MEDNEKNNTNVADGIEGKVESINVDSTEKMQSDCGVTNDIPTIMLPNLSPSNQEPSTNDQAILQPMEISNDHTNEKHVEQLPSSSTESNQCSYESTEEEKNAKNCTLHLDPATDSLEKAHMISESALINIKELNNDDVNESASSSRNVEKESECRTETKFNNKLDKSEIINELTAASVANCDSSEIVDDSMNVINSNGSSNVSGKAKITIGDTLSCRMNVNGVDELNSNKQEQYNSKLESYPTESTVAIACAISLSSAADSTEKDVTESDAKLSEQPTSSFETAEIKVHSEGKLDNTPSVHSNINDKGGGANINSTFQRFQQQTPSNEIVLNNSLDSINSVLDARAHKSTICMAACIEKLNGDNKTEICSTGDNSGCDLKHSSIVQNQVASVIRPNHSIVAHIKENDQLERNESKLNQYSVDHTHMIRSDLSHIELPKAAIDNTNKTPSTKLINDSSASNPNNSFNESSLAKNLSLDLTQPSTQSSRQNSMYVSHPDFSRHKATKDLSHLRMKPPDFTKITHAYSTNNLKIPNPNFNEIDGPKQQQPTVNSSNFAEISKRFNYISDLKLKNSTPATDSSRNMSNLYVKAPDFSGQKKNISHDISDEPTAHVIHKNPYLNQTDKSNKTMPSDSAIIYRSYPQISQDVTMSIVPTHISPYIPQHQQPLSHRQHFVDQTPDQLYKPLLNTQHPYERVSDAPYASQSKAIDVPYKLKAEKTNDMNMNLYQREESRTAVIKSGKTSNNDIEMYDSKEISNYKIQYRYGGQCYEKLIPKSVAINQQADYINGQQDLSNSQYLPNFNDRIPSNKSSHDRLANGEPIPNMYHEHYKHATHSPKVGNSSNIVTMAAPSSRPLRSPIMHSKLMDIPSGHMNPPQHWPSHSPRITQSPISLSSSPQGGRVTQSPAGASPSPQHHLIHVPSALPAQSSMYRYTTPHQPSTSSSFNVATTASSPIHFRDTVNQPIFPKPPKSKSSKQTKAIPSQPSTPNYYYAPPESVPYPGHQYSIKVEQSAHYSTHQYPTKTDNNLRDDSRTKPTKSKLFPEYVDLTKTKSSEIPIVPIMPNVAGTDGRYDPRSLSERHDFHHQNHRQEVVSNKHGIAPELNRGNDKRMYNSQQKTIMDPYAYRKASEADLNYEIIKKTLNKDISIRRSDADLSCSIFDNPKLNQSKPTNYPTSNEQYFPRGAGYQPNYYYRLQGPLEATARRDEKGAPILDANRYFPPPSQQISNNSNQEVDNSSRARGYSNENISRVSKDLKKHDLSVTVSRISSAIDHPIKLDPIQHSETTIPVSHQTSTSRNHPLTSHTTSAKVRVQQTQQTLPQNPSSTVMPVMVPLKRESPLDLSVKTVKTKADSTGDDYAVPSSSRDFNAPLSLKVDFSPNFQKHTRVSDKSTTNQPQSRNENKMPTNSQFQGLQRQALHAIMEKNQNAPQKSTDKLMDARYYNQNTQPSSQTYIQSRSQQIQNDPYKQQPKPLVLSPSVPTVFGRKPEELKNFPINPDMQEYKSTTSTPMGYENDEISVKSHPIKASYHPKPTEYLLNTHNQKRPQEIQAKYSELNVKVDVNTIQHTPTATPVESLKERATYGFPPTERPEYQNRSHYLDLSYQEQRQNLLRNQSDNSFKCIEEVPAGYYDPCYSRKRPAETFLHDQYSKAKQVRRNDQPSQHAQFFNMNKITYPPVLDPKINHSYEIPVEKIDYNKKCIENTYQRDHMDQKRMIPNHTKQRDTITPMAVPVREIIPPEYIMHQHQYHQYPEQVYTQSENRSTHTPIITHPTEQHQKHLAYQKSKKEAYKQLPSPPPNQYNYYQRDPKHYPQENYNADSCQSFQPELKTYYSDTNYTSNQQYSKQDTNTPRQFYQPQWPQNQQTSKPDSSKPIFATTESTPRNYRDLGQTSHPLQTLAEVIPRANHRLNPIEAAPRQSTTLKGADQNVISKLRTNLELKEIEKQKLLRNQSSTETMEDDNQKSDIASLIAARIRTKGELKGFTPIPIIEPKEDSTIIVRCDDDNVKNLPIRNAVLDSCSDADNSTTLDLLDWGSACNDFVEQLQGAGNKKRGRRRRGKSSLADTEFETVEQEIPLKNLPGVDYKCDIDEDLVNIVKSENKCHQPFDDNLDQSAKKNDSSSSDEDKPLLFLRQKSLGEMGKLKTSHDESKVSDSVQCGPVNQGQSNDKTDRSSDVVKLAEKIVKKKKGQQREKRENEKRISVASSSESDSGISAKVKRSKKTVRKPRTRSSAGYKNSSDDETSENGSKNSKRKNDHTKRKKSSKSSSESEPLKQRKRFTKIDSDEKSDSDREGTHAIKLTHIKQEVVSDCEGSDSKTETLKNPGKKEPGCIVNVKIEETMTRSKRKQELERQKANSKILRNEKVIKNVTISERKTCEPKKISDKNTSKSQKAGGTKDDTKRKLDDGKGSRMSSIHSISTDSENSEIEVSLRRRTRSAKSMDQRTPEKSKINIEKVIEKKWSRSSPQKKNVKESNAKPSIEQFPPGWENEVYEFKRSLKIPASLITIKRPSWYRKSISLPDLDPHLSDTSETFSEKKKVFLKPLIELSDRKFIKKDPKHDQPASLNTNNKVVVEMHDKRPDNLQSKSIIDLLHQKIIHPISKHIKKTRLLHSTEPKILPQSNEMELLPTPGAENVFKHQNVFETAVLKSRTRKEYRVQKNQEIIREVFGCDDRPASAPPLNPIIDKKTPAITFDQKYKQYLEKMNVNFGDSKLSKCEIKPDVSIVKEEKLDDDSLLNQDDETQDTEINECVRNALEIKEEPLDSHERDTPSVSEREAITPSSFSLIRKRGRGTRGGRRKGSSGFDYIRKKKKPLPQLNGIEGAPLQHKRRAAAINYLQEKDENDINREIRGWVLNKGVGETVLHKAARLGYIDVIAFCLERLEMNPDHKDNAGYTALHEASSRGQLDIARLLLQYGANHSETAVLGGIRPLHEAVENGYIEIVRLLLSYGADPLLATYSGQTPIMLAENDDHMIAFLKHYCHDIQNTGPNKMPWRFEGAWKSYDTDEYGYDLFGEVPSDDIESKQKKLNVLSKPESSSTPINSNVDAVKQITTNKCDSNSNFMLTRKRPNNMPSPENHRTIKSKYKNLSPCTVVLTNLTDKNKTKANSTSKPPLPLLLSTIQISDVTADQPDIIEFSDDDSDADYFEIEESQAPHVPLYHLRDEGAVKWALLNDLCYMLKVKSKDTLLKQICSSSPPSSSSNKELLRELKMADFLERATCLQLLCAGEKLNIRSSKVVLVKYNDSVKNLLGIKTVLMKM